MDEHLDNNTNCEKSHDPQTPECFGPYKLWTLDMSPEIHLRGDQATPKEETLPDPCACSLGTKTQCTALAQRTKRYARVHDHGCTTQVNIDERCDPTFRPPRARQQKESCTTFNHTIALLITVGKAAQTTHPERLSIC